MDSSFNAASVGPIGINLFTERDEISTKESPEFYHNFFDEQLSQP